MKKNIFISTALLLLSISIFAQQKVLVSNISDNERKGELIEIKVATLKVDFSKKSYILSDAQGNEQAYQLVYKNDKLQSILFQADVLANSTSTYTLAEGKPKQVTPKTSAQFVPERKDDFAWENDKAAYRMYGPALAKENPSNGVDLWLKRTNEIIVAKFYHDELKKGLSYHKDHGQGLDCYAVGQTLGAGGIAPYFADSLWVGKHYDSYKIIENGPLRSVFTLTYNKVKIGNEYYKQTITITSCAGALLNKAEVKYEGRKQKIQLAAGIVLHDGKGNIFENAKKGIIAYGEDAVSSEKIASGRNYIGAFIPNTVNATLTKNNHILALSNYETNKSFTYYFGGGWSKWGYVSDVEWVCALKSFAENTKTPLKIKIK